MEEVYESVKFSVLDPRPDVGDFRARAILLDAALLGSPLAQAQKMQALLVKRMRVDAAFMLPSLVLSEEEMEDG